MSASRAPHPHKSAANRRRRERRRRRWLAVAVVAVSIGGGLVLGRTLVDQSSPGVKGDDAAPSARAGHDMNAPVPPGYELTGEVGPMGGQVLKTPRSRAGDAAAGGVVVTDGADISMGHIPLAFAVDPTWHLLNTSDHDVTLGRPKVTVVKGCCPADPVLGTTTLATGGSTTLEFLTQMHPGMGGDHLFRLAVPISDASDPLVVSVAGEFS